MKNITTHIAMLATGLAIGWFASASLSSSVELSNNYIDEAFKAKQNVSVLKKLNSDQVKEARSYIAQSLAASKSYLESCALDACSNKSVPHIDSTIALINEATQ